jgi:hypothetical protein
VKALDLLKIWNKDIETKVESILSNPVEADFDSRQLASLP